MHDIFENFLASPVSESDQNFINIIMSAPAKTTGTGGFVTSKGAAPEVASVEVLAEVPKSPRSPRLRPTSTTEGPKTKKYKQRVAQLVRESPRKHPNKEKPTVQERARSST